ncbi:hypothetical protein BJI67_11205 [Acidihalobacter aeolianus]|uniref:LPS-assembly lipoprotein LptE n=1 Tax=Acidihalobacter aeolianus TaxID=2792603 RepID=A0A1D8K9D3_9GAMM|nr:hypothetical protein BJI67_11205 [Acidihalobacter aeolianus]
MCVVALALALAGCGFHLRGQAELPPALGRTFFINQAGAGPVARALKQALSANGVTLVDNRNQATAVLTVLSVGTSQRALTVSVLNQATSYALTTTLRFSAAAIDGSWKLPPQTLSVERQYSLSTTQLQSQGAEVDLLTRSSARELANLALLRLQAQAGRP